MPAEQDEVIAFLAAPETHDGEKVERLSTHGAHVFLAGTRAYKLKRAVDLGFFDFSTPEKRRAALEKELELNRPTAPALYCEVRAIRRNADGRLALSDTGAAVDWVLVMSRFDQNALLDALAKRKALMPAMIDELARAVSAMHRASPAVSRDEGAYHKSMALDNIAPLRKVQVDKAAVDRLEHALTEACDRRAAYLNNRMRAGFVRRCHGDLHLRNIVLLDGRPTPFDALEFDDGLATGDVYYDLAFLLMDLDYRGLRPLANRLLNRYVTDSGDLEGLAGLALFLATRAAVRAKVSALSALAAENPHARDGLLAEAKQYTDLANTYLPAPPARLIAVGGLSGTGKSTVAVHLAPYVRPAPGAIALRSDVLRKQIAGVSETERLPPTAYTPETSAKVYTALAERASRILAAGHSVIADAVFSKPEERAMIENVAKQHRAAFTGFWLDLPLAEREARVGARRNDASDATAAVARAQESYDLGAMTWAKIDTCGSVEDVCGRALQSGIIAAGDK